ncbi:hypothetical protein T4E_6339 [Trichinella pseudospiralis]|uniref:Uncharacterized protein n=1 Tax=Trichinella pseudospiralis TaxID=6337 RepID=A0A0V0XUB9_TRIPS|nr:hypothetical protein T4E_6339 [Trichinella pseudospiralis]
MQEELNSPQCLLQAGYYSCQLAVLGEKWWPGTFLSFFFASSSVRYRVFQSQLTDFPMYHLAEVEIAVLYLCIHKVALNRWYQGCFEITNYCLRLETDREECRFVY